MTFFSRFSTLLRADAHGVVDALEDRHLLLRQHVRDASAAVAEKRARLVALELEARDRVGEQERLDERRRQLEADADLALRQDQETLARFAIKKLLPIRRRLAELARQDAERAETRQRHEALLQEQEAQLEELRAQARAFLERDGGPTAAFEDSVAEEEVDLELLRRRHDETTDSSVDSAPDSPPVDELEAREGAAP